LVSACEASAEAVWILERDMKADGLAGGSPEVAMELLRGGARVAHGSLSLPAPDASGRVRYLGQISVGAIREPGQYTLRLTLTKHGRSVVREAAFTIATSLRDPMS
jgi:hypothetical protein